MRRESEHETAVLQLFGLKKFRRFILPFRLWLLGWTAALAFFIIPVLFYDEIFAAEDLAV
jgi:hypothetical protein